MKNEQTPQRDHTPGLKSSEPASSSAKNLDLSLRRTPAVEQGASPAVKPASDTTTPASQAARNDLSLRRDQPSSTSPSDQAHKAATKLDQAFSDRAATMPHKDIFIQNYNKVPSDLRERLRTSEHANMVEVKVAELPDSPEVRSPTDMNHHISYEDAKIHTEQLRDVVLPWVRAGAIGDDFSALDHSLNRDSRNGFYATYRLFYGNAPIKIDKTADGRMTVVNGRHRIFMAKHLDLEQIPVRINS